MPDTERLVGITFAKQFPNPAEPLRGLFVAEQVRATASRVDWRIVAPVPWAPAWLARMLGKPYVRGDGSFDEIPVARPRYPVLPARLLFTAVAPAMALASRRAFAESAEAGAAFVHAHDIYPSGAAVRRLATPVRLPVVLTVHGSDLYSNLVRPRWEAEVRASIAAAAAIVCVSAALARDVVLLAGADPARVVVIPDTYDVARFAFTERPDRSGRPLRLVTVGRLVPVKGHDVLIRALAHAVRAGLDATLEVVGGGPDRDALERLASAEGLSGRVMFSGPLGDAELPAALGRADAFVLPSRREGFGVALVEALATGMPVVATRSGGPDDIVGQADGILVEPDDAESLAAGLHEIERRFDGYDRRAIAGRVLARFGPGAVGAQLVDAYRAAIVGGFVGGGSLGG